VLLLTDITEHPTREGKVYCSCVLDAFSRRVVDWAIDRSCETALVNDAVLMASESRPIGPGSIIHSDRGPHSAIARATRAANESNLPPLKVDSKLLEVYLAAMPLRRNTSVTATP
jgi:putative transposase